VERLGRQLWLTHKSVRELLDGALAQHGGSLQTWVLLKTLASEPNLSHRELSDRMMVSGATLTHHLDRLEADGLLQRTRDLHDRRVVRVDLTPAGKQRAVELESIADGLDLRLRSLLGEADATRLRRLLQRLDDKLLERDTDLPPQGDAHGS
jgi:MarR family transcriptional regulator for hemolysin